MADETPMANKQNDDSLEPEAGTPGQRSRQHAATKIQSSVRPEDYPEAEITAQVDAAGARPEQQRRR